MAAAAKRSGNSGMSWTSGDEEQSLVFIPGDGEDAKTWTPFNVGPGSTGTFSKRGTTIRRRRSSNCNEMTQKKVDKKQGHSQSECSGFYPKEPKEQMSVYHTTTAATKHPISPAVGTLAQVISETSGAKSLVCLKDLCPEDKRRIASLIEELARVSEEKEVSVQRLKDEQENFERKIQQLEQQNLIIAQERGSLQQQYRECQELLGLYQQYLSQQQAKLNQSISQLSQEPTVSKVLCSEEPPSRTSISRSNGSLFDGSYLNYAATQSQQPQVHRRCDGGRAEARTLDNPASLSHVSECSPTNGLIRSQKRECWKPHSEFHQKRQLCQSCCQDSGYGAQQSRRVNDSHPKNDHCDTFNQHECERLHTGNAISSEAKEALTTPVLGHEDWEEKRHHLLLQKMQLEAEREKLQARLAEQEERINRQNQQLRQSHLDYNSVPEETEGQSLHEKHTQTVPAPLDNGKEALERSRKDMATSPAKPPASLSKPTPVSVSRKTPEASLWT